MEDYCGSNLKCTGCGTVFFFADSDRYHWYTSSNTNHQVFAQVNNPQCEVTGLPHFFDGSAISLLTSPCWCLQCDTTTLVERIPEINHYMKAAAVRKMPGKEIGVSDRLLDLDDQSFLAHYQWRMARTSPPKCLRCGHSNYILIDENKSLTGITHEPCWNSPIVCMFPPLIVALTNATVYCYHALSGELNWLHIQERAVFSCMTNDRCQLDLREAGYAIIRKNYVSAMDILQSLARDGIPAAITGLGALYQTGTGVEPDGSMALHYLSKALEEGDGVAAANLAMLYRFGSAGIKKDEETSWSYARTARKMGIFLC